MTGYSSGTSVASAGIMASGVQAAGITSPIEIAGLRVWLDASQLGLADGAGVATWPDLSGNNLHPALVGVGAPVYRAAISPKGLPVVRFTPTGEGKRLRWGSTWSNPTGIDKASTLFWLGRAVGPTVERVISGVNELGSNWFFGYWQSKYDAGHTGNAFMTPDLRPAWTNAWRLYTIDSHATPSDRCRVFRDGTLILTGGSMHGWKGTLALSGYSSTGLAELSDCEVGEVVAYDRELPDAERQQVEAYLRGKWL
jgi:hypothetical protein